jgi:hypothetical protein
VGAGDLSLRLKSGSAWDDLAEKSALKSKLRPYQGMCVSDGLAEIHMD